MLIDDVFRLAKNTILVGFSKDKDKAKADLKEKYDKKKQRKNDWYSQHNLGGGGQQRGFIRIDSNGHGIRPLGMQLNNTNNGSSRYASSSNNGHTHLNNSKQKKIKNTNIKTNNQPNIKTNNQTNIKSSQGQVNNGSSITNNALNKQSNNMSLDEAKKVFSKAIPQVLEMTRNTLVNNQGNSSGMNNQLKISYDAAQVLMKNCKKISNNKSYYALDMMNFCVNNVCSQYPTANGLQGFDDLKKLCEKKDLIVRGSTLPPNNLSYTYLLGCEKKSDILRLAPQIYGDGCIQKGVLVVYKMSGNLTGVLVNNGYMLIAPTHKCKIEKIEKKQDGYIQFTCQYGNKKSKTTNKN